MTNAHLDLGTDRIEETERDVKFQRHQFRASQNRQRDVLQRRLIKLKKKNQ